jgi:hypothetical protein
LRGILLAVATTITTTTMLLPVIKLAVVPMVEICGAQVDVIRTLAILLLFPMTILIDLPMEIIERFFATDFALPNQVVRWG